MVKKIKHRIKKLNFTGLKLDAGSFVFILMSIVGAISVLAEIIVPTYDANPALYPLLGVIAGLFYRGGKSNGQN